MKKSNSCRRTACYESEVYLDFDHFMSNDNKNDNKNKPAWQYTSQDLKKSLDLWDELSNKEDRLAPDEKLLNDMKKLIHEIELKIKEFN